MRTYKHYIGGKWVASHKTFASYNPATGKALAYFQEGSAEDAEKAIQAAETAYPKWSKVPAPKRGEVLLKAAQIMRKEKERLAKLVVLEMGKVLAEARGDVQEAIDVTEYMAGEGRRLFGHTTKSELPDKFAMTIRSPIGVCGLITPWNFPLAIPAWKAMPALICGNTFVLKPASDTPMLSYELVSILERAGLPKGVANIVTGPGASVGAGIIKSQRVRCISFTGSRETGLWITKNAGIKKIGLELGGKNAIIIMDDADLNLALQGVLWGAFGTTGQRCTATSRVIVHSKVLPKFQKMLVSATAKLRIGSGLDPRTQVGPLINRAAVEKSSKYLEIGKSEGAKLLCGGQLKGPGFFFKPAVFTGVSKGMRIAQEEIFGPVVSLLEARSLGDAIAIANSVTYGLSAAVYTKDIANAFRAIEGIEAGLVYVNSSTTGSEVHLPFGGVKQSGSTREAGIEGINEFSETKTVYVDYSGKLQRAQIDE